MYEFQRYKPQEEWNILMARATFQNGSRENILKTFRKKIMIGELNGTNS